MDWCTMICWGGEEQLIDTTTHTAQQGQEDPFKEGDPFAAQDNALLETDQSTATTNPEVPNLMDDFVAPSTTSEPPTRMEEGVSGDLIEF